MGTIAKWSGWALVGASLWAVPQVAEAVEVACDNDGADLGDCQGGEACTFGVCEDAVQCGNVDDCRADSLTDEMICHADVCQTPACSIHADCPGTSICDVTNVFQDGSVDLGCMDSLCQGPSDCAGGACVGGRCEKKACDDTGCGAGYSCIAGYCDRPVEDGGNGSKADDADGPGGAGPSSAAPRSEEAGCTIGGRSPVGVWALLGLLGLTGLRRRRRLR